MRTLFNITEFRPLVIEAKYSYTRQARYLGFTNPPQPAKLAIALTLAGIIVTALAFGLLG
jgi:hypothetical protein